MRVARPEAAFLLAALTAALFSVGAGACSFPDVYFQLGSSGASVTSSSGTGGGGSESASSSESSSSVGGGGGAGGSGAGGAGGAGGMGGQGGAGGLGGTDCTNPDVDGDGQNAVACGGQDCDDNDEDVFKGQPEFFSKVRPNGGGFDYDCSGSNEQEFEAYQCSGTFCSDKMNVFLSSPVTCGTAAVFGSCSTLCKQTNTVSKTMRCH